MKKLQKAAVVVGINKYPDPKNNLRGCVNDAKGIRDYLVKKFEFDQVFLLLDQKATYRNVVTRMQDVMMDLGDYGHFFFSVSSHGTSIKDRSGDEPDGRDEAICLYDRLLVDDTFRTIIDHSPVGMKSTIITDCCHSGSITRSAYERNFSSSNSTYFKPRYLPPHDDEFAIGLRNCPVTSQMFGAGLEEKDMKEILITGCKSNEYSYDAYLGGKFHGALTYNILEIWKKVNCRNITYNEFFKMVRDRLPSERYPQTPQFEGSEENKKRLLFS